MCPPGGEVCPLLREPRLTENSGNGVIQKDCNENAEKRGRDFEDSCFENNQKRGTFED